VFACLITAAFVIIFLGFSVLAPSNPTDMIALLFSAFAVSDAMFLILELDQPFGGVIGISSEPMTNALND
jgi:pyruvate/2-oxoglutarate/acetoin dehydrogenase E1 component